VAGTVAVPEGTARNQVVVGVDSTVGASQRAAA
jgi:hypothetical protein